MAEQLPPDEAAADIDLFKRIHALKLRTFRAFHLVEPLREQLVNRVPNALTASAVGEVLRKFRGKTLGGLTLVGTYSSSYRVWFYQLLEEKSGLPAEDAITPEPPRDAFRQIIETKLEPAKQRRETAALQSGSPQYNLWVPRDSEGRELGNTAGYDPTYVAPVVEKPKQFWKIGERADTTFGKGLFSGTPEHKTFTLDNGGTVFDWVDGHSKMPAGHSPLLASFEKMATDALLRGDKRSLTAIAEGQRTWSTGLGGISPYHVGLPIALKPFSPFQADEDANARTVWPTTSQITDRITGLPKF